MAIFPDCPSRRRQMLFRIDEYDIDLRIDLAGDTCNLTGQVLPGIDDATVEVLSPVQSYKNIADRIW